MLTTVPPFPARSDIYPLSSTEVRSGTGIPDLPVNVPEAREVERVTMKIDVSHTEHSHLIGKGGQNVKAMMVDTKCHIHFPDSNRTNVFEKSNQVSISGSPADVDRARKRIRQMLPLVYNFQIDRPSQTIALYRASPVLQQIEAKWQVEVSYRHQYLYPLSDVVPLCSPVSQLSSGIVVSVRGLNAFAASVMEATHFLLYYHFGKLAYQTSVWLTLEIEPKHQAFIMNHVAPRKLSDVLFETTGAKVKFPDNICSSLFSRLSRGSTSDVNRRGFYPYRLCLPKFNPTMFGELQSRHGIKTMVTITGNVENVYLARQCIMNLLPIVLMTEITNEEFSFLERLDCSSLASTYDVALSFRTKQRQLLKQSLVIKTSEANVESLFLVLSYLKMLTRHRGQLVRPLLLPTKEETANCNRTCDLSLPTSDLSPKYLPSIRPYPILGRSALRSPPSETCKTSEPNQAQLQQQSLFNVSPDNVLVDTRSLSGLCIEKQTVLQTADLNKKIHQLTISNANLTADPINLHDGQRPSHLDFRNIPLESFSIAGKPYVEYPSLRHLGIESPLSPVFSPTQVKGIANRTFSPTQSDFESTVHGQKETSSEQCLPPLHSPKTPWQPFFTGYVGDPWKPSIAVTAINHEPASLFDVFPWPTERTETCQLEDVPIVQSNNDLRF